MKDIKMRYCSKTDSVMLGRYDRESKLLEERCINATFHNAVINKFQKKERIILSPNGDRYIVTLKNLGQRLEKNPRANNLTS